MIGDITSIAEVYGECKELARSSPAPVLEVWETKSFEGMAGLVSKSLTELGFNVKLLGKRGKIKTKFIDLVTGTQLPLELNVLKEVSPELISLEGINLKSYLTVVLVDNGLGTINPALVDYVLNGSDKVTVLTNKTDLRMFKNATVIINNNTLEKVEHQHYGDLIVKLPQGCVYKEEVYETKADTEFINYEGHEEIFTSVLVASEIISKSDLITPIKMGNNAVAKFITKKGLDPVKWEDFLIIKEEYKISRGK